MRVLLVTHRYPPHFLGGVERITQSVAAELIKQGDKVGIVTCHPASEYANTPIREMLPNGVAVYRYIGGPVPLDKFLSHHLNWERQFEATLLEFQPEVVHFLHLIDHSPRYLVMAQRHQAAIVFSLQDFFMACPLGILRKRTGQLCQGPRGGQECATTCFGTEGPGGFMRWSLRYAYYRRILHLPHRFISPARFVTDYFVGFGVNPALIHTIPNGVSISPSPYAPSARLPLQRGRLNIAFIGSVIEHKGVHVILQALNLAGLEAVDVTLFGKVYDAQYLRNLRDWARSIPGVHLRAYGAYEPSQLPFLLQDIDCIITPSVWPETFAIVTREALTLGIPLLASRLGALPDAIVEGENGFTFDPQQPQELAVILRRLAQDEALIHRLREGARKTHVMTVAEHTAAVRRVYGEARDASVVRPPSYQNDVDEINSLHEALLKHGFDVTYQT